MVYWHADRLLARPFNFVLYILATAMTTDLQKTLAALASLASVLVGVVTIASYLSGEDVTLPPSLTTPSSESQPIIIHARVVFIEKNMTYAIDYNKNLILLNESTIIV
ncbi:MAG: hypothetical protein WC119_09215 [Synergistaceae bacterium]|jgi:hypothetical protein